MVTPAGDAGVPDGMRELLGPTLTGAYAMRSDRVAGAEPHDYTQGRDEDVDAAIAGGRTAPARDSALVGRGGSAVPGRRSRGGGAGAALRGAVADRPAGLGARARRAGAGGGRALRLGRRDRHPGLHPHPHGALRRLAGDVLSHRLRRRRRAPCRHRPCRGGAAGLGRGGPPVGRLLPARATRADPPLVDRRGRAGVHSRALPGLARIPAPRHPRIAQAALLRRVPPHRRRAGRARPGRGATCARPGSSGCGSRWPRSA